VLLMVRDPRDQPEEEFITVCLTVEKTFNASLIRVLILPLSSSVAAFVKVTTRISRVERPRSTSSLT